MGEVRAHRWFVSSCDAKRLLLSRRNPSLFVVLDLSDLGCSSEDLVKEPKEKEGFLIQGNDESQCGNGGGLAQEERVRDDPARRRSRA